MTHILLVLSSISSSDFWSELASVKDFHFINGVAEDPAEECNRLNKLIGDLDIHVALVGIGENGHLAFNDPPADFDIKDPYIIASLDEKCRMQQVGEGWFEDLRSSTKRSD